ncbi:hypothetical protein [Methylobacterium sp. Leaf469]|uniref:hypothetical protein n=1 Tax=Methylobacterium sp. Leaf469 TaxID=1736387 RepID=UPI000B0A2287|nr:hypothetical protein [Methylobacterium sp. Leaf469]
MTKTSSDVRELPMDVGWLSGATRSRISLLPHAGAPVSHANGMIRLPHSSSQTFRRAGSTAEGANPHDRLYLVV